MMIVTAEDLRLFERIYGAIVRFHDRQQVLICSHCHAQRTVHGSDCPFLALGLLIDALQIQESQGPMMSNTLTEQ